VFVVFYATAGAFAVLMKVQQSFHSGQMVICGNVSVPIDHRRPDCAEAYPDITARTLPSTGF